MKLVKTVIYFIILKMIELLGLSMIIFLIALYGSRIKYWLGLSNGIWRLDTVNGFLHAFEDGLVLGVFVSLLSVAIIVLVGMGIVAAVKWNWKWAKKISKAK